MPKVAVAIFCCISAMAGILVGVITSNIARDAVWKAEAVEAGHAEYYLDENNERQWRWKDGE